MSATKKNRDKLKKEIVKRGVRDTEVVESIIDNIDTLARIIIHAYKTSKK